ncbi:heme peroxidase [Lentinus tigrinus ALCF2SS1-6]|uniref:Heme peroxidase n=1 Tax=Lentinus tigrinus ALCF2SS1-6 TaxID=1328759 RepID=A0A5C2SM15_9APHY|nr:heme peroxidase [Lentinus tigrinus ALCF2SS1-6]
MVSQTSWYARPRESDGCPSCDLIPLSALQTLADVQYLAARPLPTAPDGRYDAEVVPVTAATTNKDPHSDLYRTAQGISDSLKNVAPLMKEALDPTTFQALVDSVQNKDALDDRKKLFTKTLSLLCRLPQDSQQSKDLNDQVITLLYNTLPHPPCTYIGTDYPAASSTTPAASTPQSASVGPRLPFTTRTADGSCNNVNMPDLGKARTPYARSVQNKYPLSPNSLPDPGDVFDALLKAPDFQPHPGRNSSLTFAFASLVTHQLFRTDPRDMTINNTTSYLDLSILYGTNQAEQDAVRDKASGKGLLYPDAFSEDRLIFVPPAATALLVLFSRNHNYIADMLLKLNERGTWTNPPPEDAAARARQDEEIFQTARLVNCGNFMAMIFGDYVAGFLGLGRDGCTWSMNPFDPIKTKDGEVVGRGDGNQCSVEFNVLYRWHATTAQKDIEWTESIFKNAFGDKPLDKLELGDFGKGVVKTWASVDPNPRTRTFFGLQRGPDGRFKDEDLANILHDATEKVAGAYRARGSPAALRIVEILGMTQARQWGVCTMNEFRDFLGLKRFGSFEEWNSDPEIANTARQLYGHIDNLELYPGLQAEEIMGLGPASGLCCGYTMTRAILSDAIALVRGDRFYTTDYTPANMTAWGFQDCARDPNNGAFGAAIPRLLFRHLPRHYPANSVYALFPFFTPEITKTNLHNLGIEKSYEFGRPVTKPVEKIVDTVKDIEAILTDKAHYQVPESPLFGKTASKFSIVANLPEPRKTALLQALFPTPDAYTAHKAWFRTQVQQLIKDHTFKVSGLPGTRLDVVGNVINLAPAYWVAEYILGIPLKDVHKKDGLLTPQEVNDMLRLIFVAAYLSPQPENNWSLSRRASYFAQVFTQFIEKSLKDAAPSSVIVQTISAFLSHAPHEPAHDFLSKVAHSSTPHADLVADILGFAVTTSVSLAKTTAQVVDFYLDPSHAKEYVEVVKLAGASDAKSLESLKGYVREAQRKCGFAFVLREDVKASSPKQPKQSYVLDLQKALVNPTDFPEPTSVNPQRPAASYKAIQEASFYKLLGNVQAEDIIVEIVKAVFQLPNLKPVPGLAGTMGEVKVNKYGIEHDEYINSIGLPSNFPSSLVVTYGA